MTPGAAPPARREGRRRLPRDRAGRAPVARAGVEGRDGDEAGEPVMWIVAMG